MDRWKAEQGRGREKRKLRRQKGRRERVRRKKMQARWEMKNCTPLWREAHFQVKRYKTHHGRTTFGSWDVEKVHAVVARSTFRSENVQNTPWSDHFWKLRCRKSARRCGAKHISKSKCTKHTSVGPLLEVEMSKKCTPLWREAHFEVKMYKTHHVRTIFGGSDIEKVHAVAARNTFPSQNAQNTPCTDHFWRFRCRFAWQAQRIVDLVKSEQNVRVLWHFQPQPPLHYTTLQYITLHYNYNYTFTTFYYTTLHYTPLHYTALNYIQLHYITLHYLPLHYITLHYTPLRYTSLHYTTTTTAQLHSTTLRYTKLHYTTLHYTTLHYTALHYITLHYLPLHFTTLHYTTLNYTTTTTTTTLHYTPLH